MSETAASMALPRRTGKLENLHTLCPLCAGSALANKYKVKGFTIVKCLNCSLTFVRDKLSQSELGAYYESLDQDYVYADPLNVANLSYYFYKVRSLIERKVAKGRILDIGCSSGIFLDVMSGWERHGIEFPSAVANHARSNYGENIYLGSLVDYPERSAYFDCITLFDVLDHMPDPILALEKCNRMLRPGGLLVVKVHDIGCLFARISGSRFYAIIPPYHLFYFNRHTLTSAVTRAGFGVLDIRHMAHLLLAKTIAYRLARGDTKSIFFKIYAMLSATPLGNFRIKKNLHDLITIIATKA